MCLSEPGIGFRYHKPKILKGTKIIQKPVKFTMFQKSTFLTWALSSMLIYGLSIIHAVGCNTTPIGCSGYKTYTQGGWGANCSGNNPASQLQNNFSTVFPNGVEIGCTNKLRFTSATAVRNYLPQGGTASALASGTSTNPLSGGGVFGGQLLALAINLKMDQVLSNFASSTGNLKDLVITSGNFKSWTVQQFFDEANKKIGGCTAANFTFSQYSDVAAAINENYDNGTVNKGFLNCPALVASGVVTHVSCKCGNNGAITLSVSGGFPPYTFKWNNGSTSQNRTGLTAGTYSVTVKDKINQSVSLSFTVTQPSAALMASTSVTNVTYYGGNNGKVVLNVSGGTSPYTYLWSNGATTKDLNSVTAGNYTVTITDAKGCKTTASACVKQPNPPLCNISASATATNAKCNGTATGSVVLTVTGGTAPFTYLWSNGATTKDLTNVMPGNYSVTVKDKNQCTALATATVGQPEPLTSSSIPTDAVCNGASNGSISLSVGGGTSPYTFLWSNGSTSQNLTGVSAGSYNVTITDAKGCTKMESAVVNQPEAIEVTVGEVVDVACFGGSTGSVALVSVTGGNGGYTFLWNNGATTQDLTGVSAGNYSVTVTDSKGCTGTASATVDGPSAALSANVSGSTDVSCNGGVDGKLTLTVTGGTADYTYLWSNGATTQNLEGVPAGNYSVTVTDANGCTTVAAGIVSEPTPVEVTGSVTKSTSCACNGTASLTISGGVAPYSISWSTGETDVTTLTGLCATNTLSATVTDANGCSKTINLAPIVFKEGCNAVEVVSYFQGTRYDYTPVDANRSNPNAMKGAPEKTDILGTFYALGFGGWAILRVDGSIVDKPGADLRVVETTWHTWDCNRYTERAHIEVSQDMVTWYDKGIICQDAEIDISPLPCISYVRITDMSNRADFVTELPLADGFDVDGIECIQGGVNGRKATASTPSTPVKSSAGVKRMALYPNPSQGNTTLTVSGADKGQTLTISVVDPTGREVKTLQTVVSNYNHTVQIEGDNLDAGLYLIRVTGNGINLTQKMLKK